MLNIRKILMNIFILFFIQREIFGLMFNHATSSLEITKNYHVLIKRYEINDYQSNCSSTIKIRVTFDGKDYFAYLLPYGDIIMHQLDIIDCRRTKMLVTYYFCI